MKPFRVYADTSVIGGCFDEEFQEHSRRLIDLVLAGDVKLLLSQVVFDELTNAPRHVKDVVDTLSPKCFEIVQLTHDVIRLRNAFMAAGIVGNRWKDDATHVAAAAIAAADAIVSWNFRHIVRLDRIKAYNEVIQAHGYSKLTIISPRELPAHDTE